ncbi:hypothetical protein CWI37_0150p0030 [Hamiltosporidium tvaerminnensis]|uniref:Uncharacterized protein n=1 Tax=Hamiltosporidium tvaerminnensis TaxID=1176355 RepID=A0A4Q9L9J5_9MICR|nr:hypothetical protein CWI37_0150p0030 [Hamiltosporidium tvaerminnensis]
MCNTHLGKTYRNKKVGFWSFFIFVTFRIIFTQRTIAMNFFENVESVSEKNELSNCIYSDICFDFLRVKPKTFIVDANIKILRTFIIDLDNFFLKFINEEKIEENQHNNIYINTRLLKYDDFEYFYKLVVGFPVFIDKMNEGNYLKIFGIIDIFKFKKNNSLKEFIRILWISIVFNPKFFEKRDYASTMANKNIFSSFISKISIVELLRLYRIGEATLNKIDDNSLVKTLLDDFNFDFINPNKDYLYLDTDIIYEIQKNCTKEVEFLRHIAYFFRIHTFKRIFFNKIFCTAKHNYFFNFSLFEGTNEIFLLRCLNVDVLIQVLRIHSLRNIKTINILNCNFTTQNIISWSKTFYFERLNFINGKDKFKSYHYDSDLNPSLRNIISKFSETMYIENKSNFFVVDKRVTCYEQKKQIILESYYDESKIEELSSLEGLHQMFIPMKLSDLFLAFNFYSMNFKEFKNIEISFTNMHIKDFNLRESEILNNILSMRIVNSTVNSIFLSKILLFPSLKTLIFYISRICYQKDEAIFNENKKIESLYFRNSVIEDHICFSNFLNSLECLRTLEIISLTKNTNPFISNPYNIKMNLGNLLSLKYSSNYNCGNDIPFFQIFPNIIEFELGLCYPNGTIHKIFFDKNFDSLIKLTFDGVKIGKKDKDALKKCTNIHVLRFTRTCKISEILFAELFNTNNMYSLRDLGLPDIVISIFDLQFISKLKFLIKLQIYNFKITTDIMFCFKTFYWMETSENKNLMVSKNRIFEELGIRYEEFT